VFSPFLGWAVSCWVFLLGSLLWISLSSSAAFLIRLPLSACPCHRTSPLTYAWVIFKCTSPVWSGSHRVGLW
jgi:hypothetical protein